MGIFVQLQSDSRTTHQKTNTLWQTVVELGSAALVGWTGMLQLEDEFGVPLQTSDSVHIDCGSLPCLFGYSTAGTDKRLGRIGHIPGGRGASARG
ncbi:hypothetical protein TYRP_022556 [Tyrophagus putrescentiae]|nr:hypothetical protein TYRP_022556 [Tyrophagus putrescentiae]